jgi:hypothetical protein
MRKVGRSNPTPGTADANNKTVYNIFNLFLPSFFLPYLDFCLPNHLGAEVTVPLNHTQ